MNRIAGGWQINSTVKQINKVLLCLFASFIVSSFFSSCTSSIAVLLYYPSLCLCLLLTLSPLILQFFKPIFCCYLIVVLVFLLIKILLNFYWIFLNCFENCLFYWIFCCVKSTYIHLQRRKLILIKGRKEGSEMEKNKIK